MRRDPHVRGGSHVVRRAHVRVVPGDCAAHSVRGARAPNTVVTTSDTGGMPVCLCVSSANEHVLRYRARHARRI
jgi:hypothetical protein